MGTKKRKYLVKSISDDSEFPNFRELNVVHNYLVSSDPDYQSRLRKSGESGNWSYSYTMRHQKDGQNLETRKQIDRKEYAVLMKQYDKTHWTIYQKRRCFIWDHRYYRIDFFEEPCDPKCRGLITIIY
jgi:hypothetical protein